MTAKKMRYKPFFSFLLLFLIIRAPKKWRVVSTLQSKISLPAKKFEPHQLKCLSGNPILVSCKVVGESH